VAESLSELRARQISAEADEAFFERLNALVYESLESGADIWRMATSLDVTKTALLIEIVDEIYAEEE
jgi:hypothetical protein